MYWLVFFNGSERPEVEAAFACPWLLCAYVDKNVDRGKSYTVFAPSGHVVSLERFYKYHTKKEGEIL